jgi:spore cortex formation protein SpoVR/YcgB (stage V sporulation)
MEVMNIDSRDGAATMSLYDIMEQPALIVLADDGQMVQFWSGSVLPLMDEVAAYFYAAQTQ